jgi:hypothetical protein
VSRIRKKNFHLQFCIGTPEGHQKSIFNTSKVKKNKDTYGIYLTKFADSTQNDKKNYRNTKSTNRNKTTVLQKRKEDKNSYGGYQTEFAGSIHNPETIIRTPNLPMRTKIFPKTVFLVP